MDLNDFDDSLFEEDIRFNCLLSEFKDRAIELLSESINAEIISLRSENESLKNKCSVLSKELNSFKQKENKYNVTAKDIERDLRREKLSKTLEGLKVVFYMPDIESSKLPKCDKCDEHRRIKYKSPLGRDAWEDCECSAKQRYVTPRMIELYEFRQDNNHDSILRWYRLSINRREEESFDQYPLINVSDVYEKLEDISKEDIDKLHFTNFYFTTEEECIKFCNIINEQKGYKKI